MAQFVEDRAVRDALGHAEVIRQAQALLADKDPAVRRAARAHLATSSSDEVRKLVGLPPKKSPAGSAGVIHGSRGPTGERRSPQKPAAAVPATGGKATRPATTASKPGSRFAHFAGMSVTSSTAPKDAAPPPEAHPMSGAMRQAAMRREITASGGHVAGATTPEQVAQFVLASAAKARGQTVQARTAASPAPTTPDLSTPQAAADFVIASAAKARGQRHDTAEGVAASTLAAARRAGVIR